MNRSIRQTFALNWKNNDNAVRIIPTSTNELHNYQIFVHNEYEKLIPVNYNNN